MRIRDAKSDIESKIAKIIEWVVLSQVRPSVMCEPHHGAAVDASGQIMLSTRTDGYVLPVILGIPTRMGKGINQADLG